MSVDSKLTAIADAIRAKTGGTEALTLDGMAEAVEGLQIGGGDLLPAIINRTVAEVNDSTIVSVGQYAFYACDNLRTLRLTACQEVQDNGIYYCTKLTSVELPACTRVGGTGFYMCSELTSINLPMCTYAGYRAFQSCRSLKTVKLPICETIGAQCFISCYYVESIDIGFCTNIYAKTFSDCCSLKALVIRTNQVCQLANTNAFEYCYHILGTVNATYNPDGLKDGYIYVPDALVEDYKAATNWSTYADQIKPLSEYVEVTA